MAGPANGLPRTIEGATCRYLNTYESYFKGGAHDKIRLRNYAEAKIFALRKKAPVFFEKKLPEIVNQAASALLTCDVTTASGIRKFNDTHADFLRVLDELKKSQPSGDVNFQKERERAKTKEDYRKQHLAIREKIDALEALEFDTDELGDEEVETKYQKTFAELDRLKVELRRVATYIAQMEGETIENALKFELKCPPRSTLERLEKGQLKNLEDQIATFLDTKKKRKEFPDKSAIDQMLGKLNIDYSQFKKDEVSDLTKDTLESIRSFFREKENERRNDYFESLLTNKRLLPKEGEILKSPDDIPDDVRKKLELSEKISQRKLDDYCEKYSKMPCDEDKGYDDLEDDSNEIDIEEDIKQTIAQNSALFARVKEEPRDDYENDGSDDEVVVRSSVADEIEETLGVTRKNGVNEHEAVSESEISDYQDTPDNENEYSGSNRVTSSDLSTTNNNDNDSMYKLPDYTQVADNLKKLLDDGDEDETEKSKEGPNDHPPNVNSSQSLIRENVDDDFVLLGTVEPSAKVETIVIDSSDED